MRLIIGLGNPGSRYDKTRHNIGFTVVETFARRFRLEISDHERDAMVGRGRVAGNAVMVAKPQTFMNLSGHAVAKLLRAYGESPRDLIVVYDDIDLPIGKIRLRERGSAGTHNGMRSIVSALGTEDFPRLRVGVRGESFDSKRDLADYVLEPFSDVEEKELQPTIERATDALLLVARGDLKRAMNTFNRDPEPESSAENKPEKKHEQSDDIR
jgi:PTH1 family peptidyl-tRNA hydrolase